MEFVQGDQTLQVLSWTKFTKAKDRVNTFIGSVGNNGISLWGFLKLSKTYNR